MPYTLTKTNGLTLTTVQDGTIDSTTDLVFVGKNYTGYGSPVNENFVKLLENFSNATPPTKPLAGQVWFDSTNKKIKIYNGSKFKSLGVVETSVTRPIGMNQGDLWYNPTDLRLYAFNGTEWILVGPQTISGTNNGISTVIITDVNSNSHSIIEGIINDVTATITSVDLKFSIPPSNSLYSNFKLLQPGINLPSTNSAGVSAISTSSGYLLWGTAASALGLVEGSGIVPVTDLLKRTELTGGTNYPVIISNDDGITVGLQQVLKIHVTNSTVGNVSNIKDSRIQFNVNTLAGGTYTNVINIDGTNELALLPGANNTVSLGSITNKFSNLYVDTVNGTTVNGTALNATTVNATTVNATTTNITTLNATTISSTTISGTAIYDNGLRVLTSANLSGSGVTSLYGTSNQIAVNQNIGSVVVSLPSAVTVNTINATTGNIPTVNATTVNATTVNASVGNIPTINVTRVNGTEVYDDNSRVITEATIGLYGVSSIQGTTNQVLVDQSSGAVTVSLPSTLDITVQSLRSTGSSKVHGTWLLDTGATFQATYADIAERYAADAEYEPGTVLVIGGTAEVTTTTVHGNPARAGIVSTNPAYTLNAEAGSDATHPYIALKGRVPCKVVGTIRKGDLLVTSIQPGYAERARTGDSSAAIIGRALSDFNDLIGVIEVMVV